MITENEITNGQVVPEEYKQNLKLLLRGINLIRISYGLPMTITSGWRTMAKHIAIYKEKALKAGKEFDLKQVPMKSNHLTCSAVDIYDPNGSLQKWVLANIPLLEQAGLYCEDFKYTNGWCHFQIVKPASGKRFFIP